ncbi:MAG TPA: biotin/lipoyl-containing protein, partial [Candidatus Eisenbacteria bacterium]|nr:biotin/lipoyl-containing protein [Candidatus Eisenbacteria bacterium]
RYQVTVDGTPFEIQAERLDGDRLRLTGDQGETIAELTATGARRFVRLGAADFVLDRETTGSRRGSRGSRAHGGGLESPMPGVVTRVMVKPGEEVSKGQPLLALEAMKMEHLIRAPYDGRIKSIAAAAGQMVNGGVPLVEMDEAAG